MQKLNELVKLAGKATKGEWRAFISVVGDGTFSVHTAGDERKGDIINWPGFDEAHCSKAQKKANAKYIAAANPETIIAIAEYVQELERRAEALEAKYKEVSGWYVKMKTRMLAAEAKLAELVKQRPVGKQYRVSAKGNNSATEWSLWHDGDGDQFKNSYDVETREVYDRPAPAVNLADLVPQKMTNPHQIAAEGTGWNDCIDAIIRNIEEATNGQAIPAAKVGSVADTEVQAGSDKEASDEDESK